jgi:hypothetical protein
MHLAPHKAGTRLRRELRPVRVAIFLILFGAHVLVVLYFASLRGPVPDSSDNGFATTMFFLEDKARRATTAVTKLPARAALAPTPGARIAQRALPPETPERSAQETTAPITIDWAKEAERVAADQAARQVEADAQARRRAGPAPPARQPFRWDYAHTHRVESLPGGGLIVNVSDRCALVLKLPMLFAGCKIGKIESHGDLFAHMNESSELRVLGVRARFRAPFGAKSDFAAASISGRSHIGI